MLPKKGNSSDRGRRPIAGTVQSRRKVAKTSNSSDRGRRPVGDADLKMILSSSRSCVSGYEIKEFIPPKIVTTSSISPHLLSLKHCTSPARTRRPL
jgi:hypothetical protein